MRTHFDYRFNIYIYLAQPKSGAPQFLFNSSYRRPVPVNNMHAYFFWFYLFIYILFVLLFTMIEANRFAKQSTRTT